MGTRMAAMGIITELPRSSNQAAREQIVKLGRFGLVFAESLHHCAIRELPRTLKSMELGSDPSHSEGL